MPIQVLDATGAPVTIGTIDDLIAIVGQGASPAANTVQARLESLKGYTDTLEALFNSLNGYVDGLETLIGSTNSSIATLQGLVDGLEAVFGTTGDAAAANGTVSAKLRAIATALGTTSLDFGPGTGGSRTLRVAVDSSQIDGSEYEAVAAGSTDIVLGSTGAIGDYLSGLLVIPATTSPGAVVLKDDTTAITVFAGGAGSVSNLVPFFLPLGINSMTGAWKVTTGTNVSVIGMGNFT